MVEDGRKNGGKKVCLGIFCSIEFFQSASEGCCKINLESLFYHLFNNILAKNRQNIKNSETI